MSSNIVCLSFLQPVLTEVLLGLVGTFSDTIETICVCHQLTATASHTLSSLTVLGSDTSTDNSADDVSALACLVSPLVLCFCLQFFGLFV